MKRCRKCGSDSIIVDSRQNEQGYVVRRRICKKCKHRWSTIEVDYWKYNELLQKIGDPDADIL